MKGTGSHGKNLYPTMNNELKRNLNRHFGLNINGDQSSGIQSNPISKFAHVDAMGTQGSFHNVGFSMNPNK